MMNFYLDDSSWESELLNTIWKMKKSKPQQKKCDWTDKMCLIEGRKCCVWREIPTSEVEGHLISFVNLWFSAPTNRDDSKICSTIRNVLLMLPLGLSVKLLLKDVFASAKDTAKPPPAVNDRAGIVIEKPLVDHLDDEKKANVLVFHNWLEQQFALVKISKKEPSKLGNSQQYNYVSQKLRTVIGYCALLLMRMMTKSELQMERCFPYLASKLFDRLFPELGLNVSFVCPTPDCLKLVKRALSPKTSPEAINLLHLLVFQYLKSARGDAPSQLAAEILEDGCLKVLEGNGMGLVTMFRDVKLLYSNIEERSLLSFIANSKADDGSKKNLVKFLNTYAQKDNPQHSWKWARLLSKDYFTDMNIRQNQSLCSKFAALLCDKDRGIFQHHDLKSENNLFADNSIEWANSVKEELENSNRELEETCVECLLAQWAQFVTHNADETLFKYVHCKKVCEYSKCSINIS